MKVKTSNSILRIKNPSEKEFLELWKQYQPFLIEDVAKHWDACSKWSNDYLIKQCGNNIVDIQNFEKYFFEDYKIFSYVGGYEYRKIIKYKEYISHGNKLSF
ncbi:hypothetical protein [Nostoc sp. DSM 114167]|jgi:hypothetical protein|uniref:hypothetical protein n=1 Tax=Nostoc sp. DSM 114167 TaxID=3439050 RepID=UPI004045244D